MSMAERNEKACVELYNVWSIIDDWPHGDQRYNGVKVTWFVNRRPMVLEGIRYDKLIEGYDPGGDNPTYAEMYIQELFTEHEMKSFCAYLKEHHDTDSNIERVDFPVVADTIGAGAMPAGGGADFYLISEEDDYDLPFSVSGYYDMEFHLAKAETELSRHGNLSISPLKSPADFITCAFCGQLEKPRTPYEITTGDRFVCRQCGHIRVPELAALLDYFYSSGMSTEFWKRIHIEAKTSEAAGNSTEVDEHLDAMLREFQHKQRGEEPLF